MYVCVYIYICVYVYPEWAPGSSRPIGSPMCLSFTGDVTHGWSKHGWSKHGWSKHGWSKHGCSCCYLRVFWRELC